MPDPMLEPVVLEGAVVRLEPLGPQHADDLRVAAADGTVWKKWSTSIPSPARVDAEIEHRLALQAEGRMVPWATVRVADGRAVGMTTFCNLDPANRRLEIGYTWLGRTVQGTSVNPEAKLLQLARAFDELRCIAVEFRTHWHNRQSRAAIARLGAKQDGVLRNHQLGRDGTYRDTVVFSIVDAEWPAVRLGLLDRLGRLTYEA